MTPTELPPVEFLSRRLSYDPVTGHLYWKHATRDMFPNVSAWKHFNSRRAGKKAGHNHQVNGKPHAVFVGITFFGEFRTFVAHRIIFAMMGVVIPDGMEIDHKNRNPWDNRWENLRLSTQSQNLCNQDSKKRRNPNGAGLPKGVSFEKGRYKSQIQIQGKKIYIGSYGTPEEASEAYKEAGARYHGEFFYLDKSTGLS